MTQFFSSNRVNLILAVFKLLVVPLAVGWIILELIKNANDVNLVVQPLWLISAAAVSELALMLVAVRLVQLLKIYNATIAPLSALQINLQATFYFFVIPTHVGMETVRFITLLARAPNCTKFSIASTLLLDRLFGALSSAILFAAAAAAIVFGHSSSLPIQTILAFLGGAIIASVITCRMLLPQAARLFQSLSETATLLKNSWVQFSYILLCAIFAQLLVVLSVFLALRGLGQEVPLTTLTLGVMGGNFLMLIPVSFAGLGPADVGSAALLISSGVPQPIAITAVFVIFLTRVFAGLQGAALEIWDGGQRLARSRKP